MKGDYLNAIGALKETYVGGFGDKGMSINDIVSLEKANIQSAIRAHGDQTEVVTRVRSEFHVKESFKMMSVLRNLLTNSAEAINGRGGRIQLTVNSSKDKKTGEELEYIINVHDNGPGIEKRELENIFLTGYSTKFDDKTGNIQRGLGLGIVREYVENSFHGRIDVASEIGKYTDITITLPAKDFEV